MDHYPADLAPEFDEGGGVVTPFEEWWPRVRTRFPTVPEEVARYWLHEHWSHSPFDWLESRAYSFKRVNWPLEEIQLIRSRWCDYSENLDMCRRQGEYLLTLERYRTGEFMRIHGMPPAAIIVLDNRDGHLRPGTPPVPLRERGLPAGYVLIEGHRRFNLCLALLERSELKALPVWVMGRGHTAST